MYHCPRPSARSLCGSPKTNKAAARLSAALYGARCHLALRSGGVLAIQFRAQAIKVGIEGHETVSRLAERGAASFMRDAIQGTLTVTCGNKTATGQTHRRCIERIDRDIAPIRFFDRAINVERVPCTRRIEAAGCVQPVRNKQDC